MELKTGPASIRRGLSWSPGGVRKPLQSAAGTHTPGSGALWEQSGLDREQMSRKTNLSRSASLSEKELKEARVRSQIIAAQLTVPSDSSSRGVQLFNRRKQRVNAFAVQRDGSREDTAEDPAPNSARTWAERSSEEDEKDLNVENSSAEPRLAAPAAGEIAAGSRDAFRKGDDMEGSVIQERHFLPVREEQEEDEEAGDKGHGDESPPGRINADPAATALAEGPAQLNGGQAAPHPGRVVLNGCRGASGSDGAPAPSSASRQTSSATNRTARPFFSPLTVQSPEAAGPVVDIPPPPSYHTPPLPASAAPQPVAFSPPPPPPPSYPTPALPAFASQPLPTRPPVSSAMSPCSPPPSLPPASPAPHYPPMPHYGPPTAPKPFTLLPQPSGESRPEAPVKTGILEDGAAKRASRKSMFTFKEKTTVAPNPELLSLVKGVDERKKHGHGPAPEPTPEEELLALGAEASNFLAKVETKEHKAQEAKAPEWASCLKSSRTRPRAEHRPEQTLSNVSGKGAELFAKRQSRMEKYVVDSQQAAQTRSPSPTMSLPPSWVYPSNMPGRVKAIAKNSDVSTQLSLNLKAQQAEKQKARQRAAAPPPPAPEPPPLENGCSKIEMDLSRHRPYQLNPSLFTFNPVKDPGGTLPRAAPPARNQMSIQTFSRQTSLPANPAPHFSAQCASPQFPVGPGAGEQHRAGPRITSPVPTFSPERVSSPRSGAQAPRPTFSATKAGIAAQTPRDSSPAESLSLARRLSSPEGPTAGAWGPGLLANQPSATTTTTAATTTPGYNRTVTSPVTSPWATRCQSPVAGQNVPFSHVNPSSSFRPPQKSAATSPRSPPSGSRCQSPMAGQNISNAVSNSASRPSRTATAASPISPPWGSRCQSPMVNSNTPSSICTSTSRTSQTPTATTPVSRPWGSRCQSPNLGQNISSVFSIPTPRHAQTPGATSPISPPWGSRSQSPANAPGSLSFSATRPVYTSSATSPRDGRCKSPAVNNSDSKANHRLLAKNIINAAKRKNSPSPGAVSGQSLPISPLGSLHHGYECHKPPMSPFQSRGLGAQSPTFTSPPPTPTQGICSPVRLYNTRSLTDSDASVESEDSGLRSPGPHTFNTCPRGWGGSLRVKRSTVSTDL